MQKNVFWNSCPRKLESFPSSNCSEGQKHTCPWGISSSTYNFCFWSYIRKQSDNEGNFEPLSDSNIAKLLGISTQDVEVISQTALEKLREIFEN